MRPPVMLIADDPALDFLNTIGAPRGETFEWLKTGADLCDWLVQVGLIAQADLQGLSHHPDLDAAAAEARMLREAFRTYLHDGAFALLGQVNAILAREEGRWQLAGTDPIRLERRQSYLVPAQLLVPVALAIAELVARSEGHRVRQCDGPTCTMWFRDISRNNRRRWCSMAVCGNRAKAAAHRAKSREGG